MSGSSPHLPSLLHPHHAQTEACRKSWLSQSVQGPAHLWALTPLPSGPAHFLPLPAIVSHLITPLHLTSHLIGISSKAGNLVWAVFVSPRAPCMGWAQTEHTWLSWPGRPGSALPFRTPCPPGGQSTSDSGRASVPGAPGVLLLFQFKALSCSQDSAPCGGECHLFREALPGCPFEVPQMA